MVLPTGKYSTDARNRQIVKFVWGRAGAGSECRAGAVPEPGWLKLKADLGKRG
jgi:hypothetical protein